jgi:tetratricopeptide (TPR) repeat protein
MLDEGMTAAVSGTVAPFPTSWIFCRMIDSCQLLGDYRRAGEWLDEIDSSPITPCITSYSADCDTHRTQVLVGRGAWSEAERLARRACAGMEKFALDHAGLAFYELGEVRLRIGDLEGAAAAFARASELGATAQPGAALLDRARGHVDAAAAAIGATLADEPWDALARARLLPTEVELAVEIGDLDRARTAAAELAGMADIYPSRAMAAAAAVAAGMVSLADGDAEAATSALRSGRHAWAEAGAPYEGARARVALARALAATGRPDLASSELSQAKATFEQLDARPDVELVDRLLAKLRSLPTVAGA